MNKGPARLGRVDDNVHLYNHFFDAVEEWLLDHSLLCLIILIAVLTALFVMVMFAICGVCAVESGGMRNFINTI